MELLERDVQLAQLHTALDSAADGEGRVVLVRGEAGIGKTALIRGFSERVAGEVHLFWGACDDLFTPSPLAPVWDMADAEPSLTETLKGEPLSVFRAVVELVSRTLRPTVVVIEDTHWADEATLDLIRYVGRRIGDKHGLLLLTYRDEEVPPQGGLRAVFGDLPPGIVIRIRLRPLSEKAVAELASARGVDVDDSLGLAGGNPLLVTELLEDPSRPVPTSIQDAYGTRLGRLAPEARELAELVSVVPTAAEVWLLDQASPDHRDALAECLRGGILHAGAEVVGFRHELARLAVETSLTDQQLRDNNQTILDALIAFDADPARIVHHAQAAGNTDAIVQYGPVAAFAASSANNWSEALEIHRSLEPLLDSIAPPTRAQLMEARIEVEHRAGSPLKMSELATSYASSLFDLGERASAATVLVKAAFHIRLVDLGQSQRNLAWAREILDGMPQPPKDTFRLVVQASITRLGGDPSRALGMTEKAIAIAERNGSPLEAAVAMTEKARSLFTFDYGSAIKCLREAIELAREHGLVLQEEDARLVGCVAAENNYHPTTTREWADEDLQLSRSLNLINQEARALAIRAGANFDLGLWLAAEEDAEESLSIRPVASHPLRSEALNVLVAVNARRGTPWRPVNRLAHEAAEDQGALGKAGGWASELEAIWLSGESVVDVADAVEAMKYVARSTPRLANEIGFWLLKLGALEEPPLGMDGPHRLQIEGNWRGAATFWKEREMPYEQGIALADGDTEAKLEALAIFDRLGAKPMASRIRKELRAAGARDVPRAPRSSMEPPAAGLTARQQEVLQLLAHGLSNAEIADELFISSRTAEHHVAAVTAKLNAKDRRRAVEVAREKGLLMDVADDSS